MGRGESALRIPCPPATPPPPSTQRHHPCTARHHIVILHAIFISSSLALSIQVLDADEIQAYILDADEVLDTDEACGLAQELRASTRLGSI